MRAMTTTTALPKAHHAARTHIVAGPRELWRVRGATDDLRGLAIETSFGFAFGLVLDQELVLLHLQPSLEVLVAYADRLEAALLAQGWQRLATCPLHTKERS